MDGVVIKPSYKCKIMLEDEVRKNKQNINLHRHSKDLVLIGNVKIDFPCITHLN